MSWYYDYSLGVKTKEGKIYPLGPFNTEGKVVSTVSLSRSFEPEELHKDFYRFNEGELTNELKKKYSFENGAFDSSLSYIPLNDLPQGDGLKFGFFLIDDVKTHKQNPEYENEDSFCDWMTPEIYYAKADAELKFGSPLKEVDDEGYDITPHSCRDYMPYAYRDTSSAEYQAEKIRNAHYSYYDDWTLEHKYGAGFTRVVILSQG